MFSLIYHIAHDAHPFWVGFVVLPVSLIGLFLGIGFAANDRQPFEIRACGIIAIVGALLFWMYG